MNVVAALKAAAPWWTKIAAKLVLSRLPLGGAVWQKLGLFSPGHMLDPDYAIAVFRAHYERAGSPSPGFGYLELGPGDSLATAAIAWAHGAEKGLLVDAGAYAARDIARYRPLFEKLAGMNLPRDAGTLADCANVDDMLKRTHCLYREDGLAGLRDVQSASVDMIFSQAVLEHVPHGEFEATIAEFKRILKPQGVGSHVVDYKDHLGGSLHNLRFSETTWERPWFAARSGFYTNRLRHSEVMRTFAASGFAVDVESLRRWDMPPLPRAKLAPAFRDLTDNDLCIQGATLVTRHV